MKAFTPLIFIVVIIAAFFMYIKPTFTDIQTLSTEKARYTDILQKAKDLASKRDTILAEYNAISPENIDRLKKIIPEQYDPIAIAKHINTIASKYGVIIKSVKISQPVSDNREVAPLSDGSNIPKAYSVTFGFNGTYDQFTKFIRDIDSGLLLMDITKISVGSEQNIKGLNDSTYDFGLALSTYSFQ